MNIDPQALHIWIKEIFFEEIALKKGAAIKPRRRIKSKLKFEKKGIEDMPENEYDIIFCLNFLEYTLWQKALGDFPSLDTVANTLFHSNKSQGALIIDPASDKRSPIREALTYQGYIRLTGGTYLRYD